MPSARTGPRAEMGRRAPVPLVLAETGREGQTRIPRPREWDPPRSARYKVLRAVTPATSRLQLSNTSPTKGAKVPKDHEVQGREDHEMSRGCSGDPGSQDLCEWTRAAREGSKVST